MGADASVRVCKLSVIPRGKLTDHSFEQIRQVLWFRRHYRYGVHAVSILDFSSGELALTFSFTVS